jgi:CRP-like cAMP-binding protein
MPELEQRLAAVPLFARLRPRELERLAKQMSERSWSEGETVIAEGKGGIGFWVIEEGSATVSVHGDIIRSLGPGDHFGEIALLDEGPRTATVTAATDLRCRGMVAWEFGPFVRENPDVAWTLLQTLATRLREIEARGQS